MSDEQIPSELAVILQTRGKGNQFGFMQKIHILCQWVGNSSSRKEKVGVIFDNQKIIINPDILSKLLNIHPKTLKKKLNEAGYFKAGLEQPKSAWGIYSQEVTYNKIQIISQGVSDTLPPNLDPLITTTWYQFCQVSPQRTVDDFCSKILSGKNSGLITPSMLIKHIIQNDKINSHDFLFLMDHFGPKIQFIGKLLLISQSVFSRGFLFGTGTRHVTLLSNPSNGFLFDDGHKKILLFNNTKFCKDFLFVEKSESNEKEVEINEFWDRNFPLAISSNQNISDSIEKLFPPELFD